MPDIMIDVQDITRTYHTGDVDVKALRGVSFPASADDTITTTTNIAIRAKTSVNTSRSRKRNLPAWAGRRLTLFP